MKEYKFFLIDIENGVATVTINNPKALNALSSPVVLEMIEVVEEISAMDDVRCVILTGAGEKSFVAGADIKEMYEMDPAQGKAYGILGSKAFQMIENMPQPVIAAVNGFALGGGCELAMACDIRIAAETAKFAQPECGLGIIPGFAGTQRMPRLCGKGFAKMMIYTCNMIKAEEALAYGLVQKVVPLEELHPPPRRWLPRSLPTAPTPFASPRARSTRATRWTSSPATCTSPTSSASALPTPTRSKAWAPSSTRARLPSPALPCPR